MSQNLETILLKTFTLPDLKHRLRILKAHLEAQVFGQTSPQTLSPEDSNWLNSLPPEFFKSFNKDNLSTIFQALEQEVNKISSLVLYLSFEPDKEALSSISSWLRQNLTQTPILEIKLDPGLIGGAALVKDGVYKDYSLRARIEDQKEVILAEFKKYIS